MKKTTQRKLNRFNEKFGRLGFSSYGAYLKSSHWRKFRERYAASGLPLCCVGCGSSKYQLHHQTYEHLGEERLSDVIPLCRECHERVYQHSKLHCIPLRQSDAILRRLFSWTEEETRRRFEPFRKQEAIETGMPPISPFPYVRPGPVVFERGKYVVQRHGPAQPYSEKRVRNAARQVACRMAHDGFIEKFNAIQPTDPMLMAECQRVLEELARRGGLRGGK